MRISSRFTPARGRWAAHSHPWVLVPRLRESIPAGRSSYPAQNSMYWVYRPGGLSAFPATPRYGGDWSLRDNLSFSSLVFSPDSREIGIWNGIGNLLDDILVLTELRRRGVRGSNSYPSVGALPIRSRAWISPLYRFLRRGYTRLIGLLCTGYISFRLAEQGVARQYRLKRSAQAVP
ncbi:hypothetical protein MRB53_036341 [Persea americana]|nr:hypothetical protein MRB53_036400 [Persea americana]KAJ8614928.1 hypothetical protein MRB53_036341 [Persea americana]